MGPANPLARDDSPLTELTDSPPETIQLWLRFSIAGEWVPTLTIPTDDISNYTLRPLRWLRFLGFIIYGSQGVLYTGPDGPEVDDYGASVDRLQEAYYYHSPGKRISPVVEH